MTTSIEVTKLQYSINALSRASTFWKWYKKESEIKETYDIYFDADYKTSVWRWRAFYHSLVKLQRQAKKDKDRSQVMEYRKILSFLIAIRLYGKEQYKISIQK